MCNTLKTATFHEQPKQRHQFFQFAVLVLLCPEKISEAEFYMLLVCPSSSLVLLKSARRRKQPEEIIKSNRLQVSNSNRQLRILITSWISSGLASNAAPIPPLIENALGQPMLISMAATSVHL